MRWVPPTGRWACWDHSIACYEKILAIDPGNAVAAANLAIAYRFVCDWPNTRRMDRVVEAQNTGCHPAGPDTGGTAAAERHADRRSRTKWCCRRPAQPGVDSPLRRSAARFQRQAACPLGSAHHHRLPFRRFPEPPGWPIKWCGSMLCMTAASSVSFVFPPGRTTEAFIAGISPEPAMVFSTCASPDSGISPEQSTLSRWTSSWIFPATPMAANWPCAPAARPQSRWPYPRLPGIDRVCFHGLSGCRQNSRSGNARAFLFRKTGLDAGMLPDHQPITSPLDRFCRTVRRTTFHRTASSSAVSTRAIKSMTRFLTSG